MAHLICFCGVGGTGKTTVAQALLSRHPSFLFKGSIVRDFYKMRGVKTETDYLAMTPKLRFVFQLELINYYIEDTRRALLSLGPTAKLLMDRSVHDHIAYCIYGYPDMNNTELDSVLKLGRDFQRQTGASIVYFPYPVPWQDELADGFRMTGVGKNYTLSCMMRAFARGYGALELSIATTADRVRMLEMGLSL